MTDFCWLFGDPLYLQDKSYFINVVYSGSLIWTLTFPLEQSFPTTVAMLQMVTDNKTTDWSLYQVVSKP